MKHRLHPLAILAFALGALNPILVYSANLPSSVVVLIGGTRESEKALRAERLVAAIAKQGGLKSITTAYPQEKASDGKNAWAELAKAPKDGSVLKAVATTDLILNSLLSPDETPLWEVMEIVEVYSMDTLVCATHRDSRYADYKVFFKTLKEQPKLIRNPIFGKANTFYSNYFMRLIGARYDDITKIKLKKGERASTYVENGQADYLCASAGILAPKIESGSLVPIFSNSTRQIKGLKTGATTREIGLKSLENYSYWVALVAPRGTPKPILKQLRQLIIKAVNDPEWKNSPEMKYGISPAGKIVDLNEFLNEQVAFYEKIYLSSPFLSKKED